jgi:hypothetical protein
MEYLHFVEIISNRSSIARIDREQNVVNSLYNGLLSSNRACLAQSITLTESTHPRKCLQARSLLKKALQDCKQCQERDNSYSFRISTKTVVYTTG